MSPLPAAGSQVLVVAWARFQPRTTALGQALRGEACYIRGDWPGRHIALLPLRYGANVVRMWQTLRRHRPRVLVAVTPPVLAPAVAWLWCTVHPCALVVDCHTATFHWWKWRWTIPVHRLLLRRALAALLHSEADTALVRRWGVRALLLPDDLPDPGEASPSASRASTARVVVAGSLDRDEPVAAALDAAALLPDVEVRFTGDASRLPASLRARVSRNVVFTGYLAYPQFLGELLSADAVAVFSRDASAMNRAAFEAIGLGRPLVVSDVTGLRTRFGAAALVAMNEPEAMVRAIRQALRDQGMLAERSQALGRAFRSERARALTELASLLQRPSPPPRIQARLPAPH